MSEKKIKLSIFNPLGQYFSLLHATCNTFDVNCVNEKFIEIITNRCNEDIKDDTNGDELSKKFMNSLELFAHNLKTFDFPISNITIKGQLYELLRKEFDKIIKDKDETNPELTFNGELKEEELEKIYERISHLHLDMKSYVSGDSGKTYSEVLKEIFNKKVTDFKFEIPKDVSKENRDAIVIEKKNELIMTIFNEWLDTCFNVYKGSVERFNEFLDELKASWNEIKTSGLEPVIDPAHIAAFNKFFEILDKDTGLSIQLTDNVSNKGFWSNLMKKLTDTDNIDGLKNKYRINIKVVEKYEDLEPYKKPAKYEKNLLAGICFALPKKVRFMFNKNLIKYTKYEAADLKNKDNFYKIKKECEKGSYKLDKDQIKKIFDFVKKNSTVSKTTHDEQWVPDIADTSEYFDGSSENFLIEDAYKHIEKYKNTWARDTNNNLYTKLDEDKNIQNKWKKHELEDFTKDAEDFKKKSGECGHLCIFNNPVQCEDFFNSLVSGNKDMFDKLYKMINENGFKENYVKLKKNIVKVNPTFIVLTLKAFKFHRWEKLNNDGTKTVRVESFTRWWNRMGKEFMYNKNDKGEYVELKNGLGSYKKHSHLNGEEEEELVPVPPENLELFLKLLIAFINYNEFVLNPQRKDNIVNNRLPNTTVYPQSTGYNPKFFKIKKGDKIVEVRNGAYETNKNSNEREDIDNLLDNLKKIHKPPSITDENKPILSALMGLTYAINPNGKFTFSRTQPFSTGVGYVAFGGTGEDGSSETIKLGNYKKCAQTALVTYQTIINKLKRKNITFDEDDFRKVFTEINKLAELENKVYEKLKIIGGYERMKEALDLTEAETVNFDQMYNYVDEFTSLSNIVSDKSDNITSLLFKLSNTYMPKSTYYEL